MKHYCLITVLLPRIDTQHYFVKLMLFIPYVQIFILSFLVIIYTLLIMNNGGYICCNFKGDSLKIKKMFRKIKLFTNHWIIN